MAERSVNDFFIPGNEPLTALIKELSALICDHMFKSAGPDYDAFLAPFEKALAREDWPKDDASRPYTDPDSRSDQMQDDEDKDSDGMDSDDSDDDSMSIASDASETHVEYLLFLEPPDDAPPTPVL